MASSKDRGLGRGLGALLGDNALQPQEGGSLSLPISEVQPGLKQPRKRFDDEALQTWPTPSAPTASSSRSPSAASPPAITRSSPGSAAGGRPSWRASMRSPPSSSRPTTAP